MEMNSVLIRTFGNVALHALGEELFNEAQRLAPSKSGSLKESGTFVVKKNNIIISYAEPYAYTLHEGGKKGAVIGDTKKFPWVADTRAHRRKLPSGRITLVRRHNKFYGQTGDPEKPKAKFYHKPTKLGSSWKVINQQLNSNIAGRRWVQKAWDKVRSRQPTRAKMFLPRNLIITDNNK